MNCNICGNNNSSSFEHSAYSDDIFICDNKIENVEFYRCDICGHVRINEEDLRHKARLKAYRLA